MAYLRKRVRLLKSFMFRLLIFSLCRAYMREQEKKGKKPWKCGENLARQANPSLSSCVLRQWRSTMEILCIGLKLIDCQRTIKPIALISVSWHWRNADFMVAVMLTILRGVLQGRWKRMVLEMRNTWLNADVLLPLSRFVCGAWWLVSGKLPLHVTRLSFMVGFSCCLSVFDVC